MLDSESNEMAIRLLPKNQVSVCIYELDTEFKQIRFSLNTLAV